MRSFISCIILIIALILSLLWLWAANNYSKNSYEPLITCIGLISAISAMVISSFFKSSKEKKRKTKNDVFISSPMTSVTLDEYKELHDISIEVKKALKDYANFKKIYYAAENHIEQNQLDDSITSAEEDLRQLSLSKYFVYICPKKVITSCHVEIGYALALGMSCTFFVKNKKDLPYMIQEVSQLGDKKVVIHTYETPNDIIRIIQRRKSNIFEK